MYTLDDIKKEDQEIASAITDEFERQNSHIELIASENWVSPAVMSAMGSILTNKYAEGYPGRRYYGGCECVDEVEELVKSKPSTPLNERNMTGYLPICSSQSTLLPEIYKPSNKDLSIPISKKLLSILILSVFPKRLGRVKRVTFPHPCKSCSISLVLSI